MTTYRFQSVRRTAEKSGNCPSCGKRVVRRQTFEQTVNPFNRNADGTVKTAQEVDASVKAEAAAWVPDFRHNTEKCQIAAEFGVTAQ